ncbi:MAG: amidohydrolase family protein [Alphaproteobacteria bacterium]|nr:amidohydrolase family protein [Alphaproteobacteria bacterium]
MIIDAHTHYHAHGILNAVFNHLYGHNYAPIRPAHGDEELHLKLMDERGYDMQIISQPPFTQVHDQKAYLGIAQARAFNTSMAKCVEEHPGKFRAVASLPLQDIPASVKEMNRAIKELGMIGCMLNVDISRRGTAPTNDEEYWFPIYEEACKLNVPLFVHPGSSGLPRHQKYSLALHLGFIFGETEFLTTFIYGDVFKRFPDLKILCSHGGGAIPYQVGRFQASTCPDLKGERGPRIPIDGTFLDNLRKMHFDTCMYSPEGIECLIKVVGVDQVLFGTECPGMGMARRPDGRSYDNVEDYINGFGWLSEAEKAKIFSGNAIKLFKIKV